MLNDFLPIIKRLNVDDHPKGITIVPLADAHYGSEEFNEVLWHKTIQRIQDDPHCFTVLVGDLLDNGTRNSVGNVYRQTASPRVQKEWLINELRPLAEAGKILAVTEGNHERRSAREVDMCPLYDVMLAIGCESVYRENICFLQVKFCYTMNGTEKQRAAFAFAITHGAGGGMYIGSSANRTERYGLSVDGIDCIITGHTHRPVTFPVSKLVFDGNAKMVMRRQFTVVVASSFLDYGGYPIEKMLPPTAHTITEIRMTYSHRDGSKELRVLQ